MLVVNVDEEILIKECLDKNPAAQQKLYKKYASVMLGVCMRYCKSREDAEDVFQEAFVKVFNYLHTFKFNGSFEGWVRRIMVNTSLRKYATDIKRTQLETPITEYMEEASAGPEILHKSSYNDLLRLINELPSGYRMVFNMYAIEGYSHKEIAEMLDIEEVTSRTQLAKARKLLQEKLSILYKKIPA